MSDVSDDFVEVDRLTVRYGRLTAVNDISFGIGRGAVFGFIGPNGAGKSSTIKVMATLLRPSTGRVRIGGIDVRRDPDAIRRMIGYVPDAFGVYEDLNVEEYLHFFAAAYRIPRADRKRIIGDSLELTDLTQKTRSPVDGLSRGMKQRLSIARVLLHDPKLLLLDEPASGLDPRARIEMRELLKELQRMGKTILVSSHILSELAQLCSQIGIIEAGQMVAHGPMETLFAQVDLKRVVHVQFARDEEGVVEKVMAMTGVADVQRQVDRYAVQIHEGAVAIEQLHGELHELGLGIRMFQPEALDMETAFMKLTEGKTA
ncbi:MAG: ABC transporter ATP-binding protein [Planctomycetota bacterium]|jgi:ABC-2 type transport system ATP-binding protein|nr:ABC transporter ATP-binding protein [Planctomycetota bacterium]